MKLIIGVLITAVLIGLGYHKFNELTRPLPKPTLKLDKYWGPGDGSKYKEDTSIKPFKVKASEEVIEDLRTQLNRTLKFQEPLEGISFQYGFNSKVVEQLAEFWRDDYLPRWKGRQANLNILPQFTTEIQGLKIHYIHSKPTKEAAKDKKVMPVLLLHGWPGSVREFYDFIPLLTQANDINSYVFEVVAPSLVGFGWSDAAAKQGFNAAEMAIVMRNLMLRLGYDKFLVQGGDWGSIIGSIVATIFPENVVGYHSNMCTLTTPLAIMKLLVASYAPEKFLPSRFFLEHHFPLKDKLEWLIRESGYFHLQATKPDTIGIALTQSPLGLAAYILEKFQSATGPVYEQKFNALESVFTLDAVLDNIMIYYLSNTATSAGRFYKENMSKDFLSLQLERVPSPVAMGCIRFKHDLPAAMEWQLIDKFPNLIHSKYVNQAGHFAAMEVPSMLYIDFTEFVTKVVESN